MLLHTWMGLHREPQKGWKMKQGSQNCRTSHLPPTCRLLTAQHSDRDPAWHDVGQGEGTVTIILCYLGQWGDFSIWGAEGDRRKGGASHCPCQALQRGQTCMEHLGQGNGPGGFLLPVPSGLPQEG